MYVSLLLVLTATEDSDRAANVEAEAHNVVIYFLIENWPNLRFICGRRGIGRTRFFNLNEVVGRKIMFLCVLRCR